MSNKRLIDGTALLKLLRDEIEEVDGLWRKGFDDAIKSVIANIESGRFDISNQGEAARLREALEWYADKGNYDWYEVGDVPVMQDEGKRAREALSSHTEDTGELERLRSEVEHLRLMDADRLRLQVALIKIRRHELMTRMEKTLTYRVADEALKGTAATEWQGVLVPESEIEVHRIEDVPDGQPMTEDTGIQKVRESDPIRNNCVTFNAPGQFTCRCEPGTCRDAGITIPGITDGGDADAGRNR